MAELDIQHIKANTPQAKGRVERLWQTLQDRLPVEFRLLGAHSMDEANKALPKLIEKHNKKSSVTPAQSGSAYMPLDGNVCLAHVFALRASRKIGGGNSVSYKNNIYVPAESEKCGFSSKMAVEVRETFSGEVFIWHGGQAVKLRKIERQPRAAEPAAAHTEECGGKTKYKPAADHPWRNAGGECIVKNSNVQIASAQ
jgi:hypothetical protein